MKLPAVPRTVWAITALWVLLMVSYSLLFPSFRAPDEPEHFDLVLAMSNRTSYPAYDELMMSEQTTASQVAVLMGRRNLEAAEATPRGQRATRSEFGPDIAGTRVNRMPQHPPLYYAVLGTVMRIAAPLGADALAHDQVLWLVRLLNVILMAPLPLLAFRAGSLITGSVAAGSAAALVPLAIPQLVHVGSSVNNDNLQTLLAGVLTVLLIRVIKGDNTLRLALVVGLVTGLALLTKGFALVLPLWVVVAYVMAWRRGVRFAIAAQRVLVIAGVSFVAGGWWWFRNLVVHGSLHRAVPLYENVSGLDVDPAWWTRRYLTWLAESFWGWMGWFEAKLPEVVIGIATIVVLTTLVVTFVLPASKRLLARSDAVFLLLPAVLMAPIAVNAAWSVYANTGLTAGIQGRYLFLAIVGIAAVLGGTWAALRDTAARWVLAAAAVMQVAALLTVLSTYYGAEDAGSAGRVGAWLAWAPLPAAIEIIAIGAVVVGFAVAFVALVRHDERQVSRV